MEHFIGGIFSSIGDIFSMFGDIDLSVGNLIAALIVGLTGSFGDIIHRIVRLNGSMDKKWTLLLFMPPFSFLTSLMILAGRIKKAPGDPVIDKKILPIMAIVALFEFTKKFGLEGMAYNGVLTGVLAGAFLVVNYLRDNDNCNKKDKDGNTESSLNYLSLIARSALQAGGALTLGMFLNIIFTILGFFPPFKLVTLVFDIIEGFGFNIKDAFAAFLMYVIMNIYGNNNMASAICGSDKVQMLSILAVIFIVISFARETIGSMLGFVSDPLGSAKEYATDYAIDYATDYANEYYDDYYDEDYY